MIDEGIRISIVIDTTEYLLTIDDAAELYRELKKLFTADVGVEESRPGKRLYWDGADNRLVVDGSRLAPTPMPVYVPYYVPCAPSNPYQPTWTWQPWSTSGTISTSNPRSGWSVSGDTTLTAGSTP